MSDSIEKNIEERISKVSERWFLTDPLLFSVYCTHRIVPNVKLNVPFRTGQGRVEFSPDLLQEMNDCEMEELLRIEMFRILLKHPYQRQPSCANRKVLAQASNVTIDDVYQIQPVVKKYLKGLDYNLPYGLCFEEYYSLIYEILTHANPNSFCGTSIMPAEEALNPDGEDTLDDEDVHGDEELENESNCPGNKNQNKTQGNGTDGADGDGGADGNEGVNGAKGTGSTDGNLDLNSELQSGTDDMDAQISELWEEDDEMCCDVNNLIEIAQSSDSWGSIGESFQSLIKASLKIQMDYRKMLSAFRTSVISSKRCLTRMRPNRRFGFDAMGCRYELATNLLIAVDVSGSVTDKSLSHFFSIINRFFKYGIEKIDVIQFDAELKSDKPVSFKKAKNEIKVMGRGGTSFQPAADYYSSHPKYDGLIYFTDGYAPPPVFNTKRPIDVLWVLCGSEEYERNHEWIKAIKRNRVTYIPSVEVRI